MPKSRVKSVLIFIDPFLRFFYTDEFFQRQQRIRLQLSQLLGRSFKEHKRIILITQRFEKHVHYIQRKLLVGRSS